MLVGDQASLGGCTVAAAGETIEHGLFPSGLALEGGVSLETVPPPLLPGPPPTVVP